MPDTLEYMANTFNKPKVYCEVGECMILQSHNILNRKGDTWLVIYIDGIAIPFEWFNVIGMTAEEKAMVAKYK